MLRPDSALRGAARLLLGFAPAAVMAGALLLAGCGGEEKPVSFDPETQKKNQELMSGGYRDQILATQKAKAAAKKKK